MWRRLLLSLAFFFLLAPGLASAQKQITIAWSCDCTDEDGFRIERSQGQMNSGFTEIATVGANVTTYTDSDPTLIAGTRYCYRVRSFNGGGNSAAYTNARCGVAGPKETLRIRVIPQNP